MILLDPSTTLEVVLASAVASNELEFQTTYIDTDTDEPGGTKGFTSGTTDVALVSPPSSSSRLVRQCSIYNADTASATVTVKLDDGVNEYRIPQRTIEPGQTLVYDSYVGWYKMPTEEDFIRYLVHLQDQKAKDAQGGELTSGAWRTRELNKKLTDEIGVTLSSNQIQDLPAGTYFIEASIPGYKIKSHKTRLQNITDSTETLVGTSEFADDTVAVQTRSVITGRFSISADKTFEIQHRCQITKSVNGLGVSSGWTTEVYVDVKIWKVA